MPAIHWLSDLDVKGQTDFVATSQRVYTIDVKTECRCLVDFPFRSSADHPLQRSTTISAYNTINSRVPFFGHLKNYEKYRYISLSLTCIPFKEIKRFISFDIEFYMVVKLIIEGLMFISQED